MGIILGIGGIIVAVVLFNIHQNRKRRADLLAKKGDQSIEDRIMNKKIWQGMSEMQLIDSWGIPVEKGQKLYKTKASEVFKYNQTGKNRFASRVRVENGIVVGWEQK